MARRRGSIRRGTFKVKRLNGPDLKISKQELPSPIEIVVLARSRPLKRKGLNLRALEVKYASPFS